MMKIKVWSKHVKREYARLQKLRSEKHVREAKTAWNQNRKKLRKLLITEHTKWQQLKTIWITKPEAEVVCVKKEDVARVTLNSVQPIPPMKSWVSIKQNIFTDDEKFLYNIPFLDDAVLEQDTTFINELTEAYDGKIHDDQESQHIDDEMFIELADALMRYQSVKLVESENTRPGKKPIPSHIIFRAISSQFPHKGNAEELREKYIELTEINKPDTLPSNYVPNLDESHTNSLSRDKVMHSFRSLFCRRCYKYDCLIHTRAEDYVAPNLQKRATPEFPMSGNPCGPACYLLTERMCKQEHESGNSSTHEYDAMYARLSAINIKVEPGEPSTSHALSVTPDFSFVNARGCNDKGVWTESEKSIFRVLQRPFLNHYCAIAKMMLTKTCQQVHLFAQQEPIDIPMEDDDSSKFVPPKKSKNKRRMCPRFSRKRTLQDDSKDVLVNNYTPCDHPGRACDDMCSCIVAENCCEKFCQCSSDCENKFRGCRCKSKCNTKRCICYLMGRECDPDLCQQCKAGQFDTSLIICKNINIQRGLHKHLLMAPSDVAGWGVFLKDDAKRNEFIYEYCGEIISHEEAERRGKLYDKCKCSYLFNLNKDFVVDATRKGNKIRFANYSNDPNCYAKVMLVNGDHRIGIFAKRAICRGEELFFDYRYSRKEKKIFFSVKEKK